MTPPGKSMCCLLYTFNVARSTTSAAVMRCSASAACSVAPLSTGNNGCLTKFKVANRPRSCEMASRKCLRTASRISSFDPRAVLGIAIPCAIYNFRAALLCKWLFHSRTCFKRLIHRGCASCARSHCSRTWSLPVPSRKSQGTSCATAATGPISQLGSSCEVASTTAV